MHISLVRSSVPIPTRRGHVRAKYIMTSISERTERHMREIKFRAWDKDLKKMCEDFLSLVEDAIYQHQANPWQDERFIPMQFTGLYDKHRRVEIYEGDIVRRKGSDGTIEI